MFKSMFRVRVVATFNNKVSKCTPCRSKPPKSIHHFFKLLEFHCFPKHHPNNPLHHFSAKKIQITIHISNCWLECSTVVASSTDIRRNAASCHEFQAIFSSSIDAGAMQLFVNRLGRLSTGNSFDAFHRSTFEIIIVPSHQFIAERCGAKLGAWSLSF